MKDAVIGIDLGGTQLRAVCCRRDGTILARAAVPTSPLGPTAVIAQMVQLFHEVRGERALDTLVGVGVGAPGPVDGYTGMVYNAPNLPSWRDVPLQALLQTALVLPVAVGNDANVAALGEWQFGTGRGTRNFVYVTISTGIGGGVIAAGKLLLGRKGLAGEVGHMTIDVGGPLCGCGNFGCWEALASGTSLGREASITMRGTPDSALHDLATPDTVTAAHVWEAAQNGDSVAQTLLHREGMLLGVGLVNLLHLYSPERIALGGGVTHSYALFRATMEETIAARAMPPYRDVPVGLVSLGSNVGLLGAAALALTTFEQSI